MGEEITSLLIFTSTHFLFILFREYDCFFGSSLLDCNASAFIKLIYGIT